MNLETFIARWKNLKGGNERAQFPQFILEFCQVLGLDPPSPDNDDYRFEAPVSFTGLPVDKAHGRIDLYKKRHFVLEAKQPPLGTSAIAVAQPAAVPAPVTRNLFGDIIDTPALPAAKPKGRRYDQLMDAALRQARDYALALPADHGWPPFLIVCDVGRAFELHFDWAGNGKGYGFFPDAASYRIELDDLRKKELRERLIGIWTDPRSIDPRLKAVLVTREIAERLAKVSKSLEVERKKSLLSASDAERSMGIEETALFLMRMLFCMFAEDVGLLPKDSFQTFLGDAIGKSKNYWHSGLGDLWKRMNDSDPRNRYWSHGDAMVRYFNGNLFANPQIYDLEREEMGELLAAAKCDWKSVEPAIFGTLLEQALTDSERAKLGAHYTPRPYVERLVEATIMEVLRSEWDAVRGALAPDLAAIHAFHDRLASLKILDPACGTGNFLYVAMENLLRLEADVLVLVAQLGGEAAAKVGPNQFLGLELNPRAAVIAELVLWIGWLRFRLANDPEWHSEPVLPPLHNINGGSHGGVDALLSVDPVTGSADLANPRAADWPAADFIIGNPPFIGGKDLREKLGSEYAEALWAAKPNVPKSADLVMQWWDRAAAVLTAADARLLRFGFVTTNSVTQSFSRRVIAARLENAALSLRLAIADHPWTRASRDAAAVRIAMTVARAGAHDGELIEIIGEAGLDSDEPALIERRAWGSINADLTQGADVTATVRLKSNEGICHDGVKLHGKGFSITKAQAEHLGWGQRAGIEAVIRPYRNGKDLNGRTADEVQSKLVIDLFGFTEFEVRQRFPEIYQHVLKSVKPERDENRRATYRDNWWIFGEPRREMRPALLDLKRYIGTVDTAKHRVFQFLPVEYICDDKVVVVGSDSAFILGVLSSGIHVEWSILTGGWLGFGNDSVYVKSRVFDPFPFPDATPAQRAAIAALAEELDMTRRLAQGENPGLTMTGLYNLVVRVRGDALSADDEAAATRARARIIAKLHADIDAAVAAAYGWGEAWQAGDLAPAEIVARLVALNAERAAEEAAGIVRWLRPDYQTPLSVAP